MPSGAATYVSHNDAWCAKHVLLDTGCYYVWWCIKSVLLDTESFIVPCSVATLGVSMSADHPNDHLCKKTYKRSTARACIFIGADIVKNHVEL